MLAPSPVLGTPRASLEESWERAENPGKPRGETRMWWALAFPLAVTLITRQLTMFTDLAVLGQWDSSFLGAVGVATVYTSLTSVVVWRGVLEALNMLCAQAFGAKNPRLAGEWLRIGLMVGSVISVMVGLTWAVAGTALQPLAKFDDQERDRVNHFSLMLTIGLIPFTAYVAITNYMSSANIVMAPLYINVAGAFLNLFFNLMLVGGPLGLGFLGSALATSLTRLIVFLAVLGWIFHDVKTNPEGAMALSWPREWFAAPKASLSEFGRQAAPIALSSLLEEAQIQVIGIMAARLGDDEMATHNAMLQIVFVLSALMWAASSATQVRMSAHLGAGNIPGAKRALFIGSSAAFVYGLLVSATFIAARGHVARVFTQDEKVIELTGKISWLVGLGFAFLAWFYIAMAALMSQGRPTVVAVAFFIGAWGVGVPSAVIFAFHVESTKGIFGLWLGLTCGYALITIIALVALFRSDWESIARDAVQRSRLERAISEVSIDEPLLGNETADVSGATLL